MRPLPARLQAARRPARRLLRAQDAGRPDGAHHLRPQFRFLRRSDREETAQPFLPRQFRALVRHRRLQPGLQVLPELGYLEIEGHGPADGIGQPGKDRPGRRKAGLQERRLHLQRPGHLRRIRARHRRRLPPARHTDRRGDRRLPPPGSDGRVLRRHGRRECGPERLYRRVLCQILRRSVAAHTRHADLPETRNPYLVRDHHAADPDTERQRCGNPGPGGLDRPRTRSRRAIALHRLSSRLEARQSARHAARDAATRAQDRTRCRPALRLHRQRSRPRGRHHLLPELQSRADRARLVRDPRLPPRRERPLSALRRGHRRPLRPL